MTEFEKHFNKYGHYNCVCCRENSKVTWDFRSIEIDLLKEKIKKLEQVLELASKTACPTCIDLFKILKIMEDGK